MLEKGESLRRTGVQPLNLTDMTNKVEPPCSITREWAMPNSKTFSIKPIEAMIKRVLRSHRGVPEVQAMPIVDPFCNGRTDLADITNDLNPDVSADYHMDALAFLKSMGDASVGGVLFDPPYSPRQVSECYKRLGQTVNMQTTQSSFWSNMKKEVQRVVADGGFCFTCGWNSGGMGKKYGFRAVEILLVGHGGWHNDTICVLERRVLEHA